VHHASSVPEDIILFLFTESKNIEGLISKLHVFLVVNGGEVSFPWETYQ